MSHRYRVYGLALHSEVAIDGLAPLDESGEVDCEVRLGAVDLVSNEPDVHLFNFVDGTRFRIEENGARIITSWTSTREDMCTYLLGPILAFVLRLRGTLSFHASAAVADGRAVLVAGAPGAGKSTAACALVERGARMLTDDVAVIDWRNGAAHVLPGYPRLRLWDDSASALYGSADVLPPLTPTWSKRFAEMSATFLAEPAALGAIVVLTRRWAEPTRVRRLTGHEALMAVLPHTSLTSLLDPSIRARELEQVAEVVRSVPVLEVFVHDDLSRTSELAAEIGSALG